jgi:hypothetical protein
MKESKKWRKRQSEIIQFHACGSFAEITFLRSQKFNANLYGIGKEWQIYSTASGASCP